MKHIAIVVGIKTDAISIDNFPRWLQDIPDNIFNLSKERWGKNEYGLASDVGIAYYLLKKSFTPYYKKKYTLTILTKKDISKKIFDQFDYIIGLYDPYYYALDTKISENYKKYNHIIQHTKAIFYQSLALQKFVLNKKLYLNILRNHGFPVLDTYSLKITDKMNSTQVLQKIKIYCSRWNTNIFITKPQPGGFGIGFKKWNLEKLQKNYKPLNNYLQKIKELPKIEAPYLLIQNFVPDFEQFYEIRTYWLCGKYSHSLGTIIDPLSLGTSGFEKVKYAYPKNEYPSDDIIEHMDNIPEIIDNKLIQHLKKIGSKIFHLLPEKNPFIFRIDFGCCLQNKNICRDYFISEIEYLPNIFPEYNQHVDIMKRVGDSILKKTIK